MTITNNQKVFMSKDLVPIVCHGLPGGVVELKDGTKSIYDVMMFKV
jgi:hypothetical protein